MYRHGLAYIAIILAAVALIPSATPTARAADLNVTLIASGTQWHVGSASPPTIMVVAGDTLRLTIRNDDGFAHTFTAPQFSVDKPLAAGATIFVNITTSAALIGNWQFYCAIAGHTGGTYPNKSGMVGTIAIVSASPPPTQGGVDYVVIGSLAIVVVVIVAAVAVLLRRRKPK